MNLTKKFAKFGIDKISFCILKQIQKQGTIQPYPLSRLLPYPRTTTNYRLNKLEKNGWIKKARIGKRSGFLLTEQSMDFLAPDSIEDETSIRTFSGLKRVKDIFEKISQKHPKERGYFIEPLKQSLSLYQKLGSKDSKCLQLILKKSGQIYEGIASESTLTVLKHQDSEYVQSMFGRMIELYVVPDDLLQVDEMVFVLKDRVYLIDVVTNNQVEIVSERLANVLKSMIKTLKFQGKKFNLNEYVRAISNNLKGS